MGTGKFHVISYGIVDDRKRAKVADILKDYGRRVQKSVFETRLDARALDKLLERLAKVIDPDTDSVRAYAICEGCVKQIKVLGAGVTGIDEEYRVL